MLRIVVLLNDNYSKDTEVGDILDDCTAEWTEECEFESLEDLYLDIENTHAENAKWENRKDFRLNKIISFVYSTIMNFPDNKFEIKTVVTKYFFSNVRDLIYGGYIIHYSHVTGEVIGYAHHFCNKKIREIHNLNPVLYLNICLVLTFSLFYRVYDCVFGEQSN